jgi:hypothetical protein
MYKKNNLSGASYTVTVNTSSMVFPWLFSQAEGSDKLIDIVCGEPH